MVMYNTSVQNARADATTTPRNGGTVRAYNGTPPASANAALSGNTLLAQGTLNATFAPAASGGGSFTSNSITGANAVASGTPTFYRCYASDGTTCVSQHNTTDFVVSPTSLTSGVAVTWNPVTHTEPAGT